MAKKVPNIEWNQTQLEIALGLSKDKTAHEIIAEGQFTETLVYKVAKAIKGGNEPPSLDEAYIASAPPATPFATGKKKENKLLLRWHRGGLDNRSVLGGCNGCFALLLWPSFPCSCRLGGRVKVTFYTPL